MPRLGDLARLDAVPETERVGPRWSLLHAAALAGCVVAVVAGATGAAVATRAAALVAIDAERMRQVVEATSVAEIHRSMETFARRGLVRDLPPPEQALLRHAAWLGSMSRAAWAVAAGGGILAVVAGVGLTARRQRGPPGA